MSYFPRLLWFLNVKISVMDSLIDAAILSSIEKLGYSSIRPQQKDVLCKILSGQDALYVAPTGSEKSLRFEAIPFALSYMNMRKHVEKKTLHW